MARKLYISDCHFFQRSLLRSMDHRPFCSVEEMNEHMIRKWNASVGPKDEVYILGDFSFGKAQETERVIDRLRGKLHLIWGNHDLWYKKMDEAHKARFVWVEHMKRICDDGRTLILSHYPVFCYPGQYQVNKEGGSHVYMLYGHVHDSRDERLVHHFLRISQQMEVMGRDEKLRHLPCQMINTFCMFSDYQPKSLDEWITIDAARRQKLDNETADMEEILRWRNPDQK